MAKAALSRAQIAFLASSAVTTVMSFSSLTGPGATGRVNDAERFRYEAVLPRSGERTVPTKGANVRELRNACESRRKAAVVRNATELGRCLSAAKERPPLREGWILGMGAAGALLGVGLALSGSGIAAPRKIALGGVIGFTVMGGGALATRLQFHKTSVRIGEEYCRSAVGGMEPDIRAEYTNCLARGQIVQASPKALR